MNCASVTPLLDATLVDFSDVDDILGFGALTISCAGKARILLPGGSLQSAETVRISCEARKWVNAVRSLLPALPPGDALRLADTYDLMHRIAFRTPVPVGSIEKIRMDAFDARIHGDTAVDRYELFRAIGKELRRRNRAFFRAPFDWQRDTLYRWLRTFRTPSSRPSDYDTLAQLSILLSEDLYAFEPDQQTFKRRLFTSHRHYLDTLTDDYDNLNQTGRFLTVACPYLTDSEYVDRERALIRALAAHPRANRFYRASLTI